MLGDRLQQQEPCVSAVVGITGRADQPVVLRLGLPTLGLMPPDAAPSPPLSPPSYDTLDLLDALDLGDMMDELDSNPVHHGWCDSELMECLDSLSGSDFITGQHKRACVMSVRERA